jgi:hypothetical protein
MIAHCTERQLSQIPMKVGPQSMAMMMMHHDMMGPGIMGSAPPPGPIIIGEG